MNVRERIKEFESKLPEIVFEWKDRETGAEGWTVINSLRGGAAGGGTRMRKGLDRNEVLSLAKTMEVKFAVCGPSIGGAKSGINFDPADPRKEDVLRRWYKAVMPLLKTYYGTGGDLNVDEIKEVIPITEEFGLRHPQEGVLNGHFNPDPAKREKLIRQLREGVLFPVTDPGLTPDPSGILTVADMITGWGVSEAVRLYYDIWGGDLKGKRAIIQGWGNVASAAAYYLAQNGVKITGIIDRAGGLLNSNGFTFEEIKKLFEDKNENRLVAEKIESFETVNAKIWDSGAEIFIPAAASRLVTEDQVSRLSKNGLEVISCGANVPFADPEIFMGKISEKADSSAAVIPDFIANCGMARTFAYLMENEKTLSDREIFDDVTDTISNTLLMIKKKSADGMRLTETAYSIVLDKILKP